MEDLTDMVANARSAARAAAAQNHATRQTALQCVQKALREQQALVEAANKADIKRATQANLEPTLLKRLDVTGDKFEQMLHKIDDVQKIDDPVGATQLATKLDDKLELYRVACPIGVIAIIFESRPDAAVQISALALKSANAVILKGGKEAADTNRAIVAAIQSGLAAMEAAYVRGEGPPPLPPACVQLVSTRDEVSALLAMHGAIDLVVPRGSNALVSHIMANTRIPVMGHADGICAVYLDASASAAVALRVVVDSKINYPVACNAAEKVLVHAAALEAVWPAVAAALLDVGVELRCDSRARAALPDALAARVVDAAPADFRTEFGGLVMAVGVVDSVDEAVEHINTNSSHHTDCIVAADADAVRAFTAGVDSAGVFVNASTRFADGQRYGFGAEVGVSTNRIHSRGPMGVEGLLIYKYLLFGEGHIVSEYSAGERTFKHTPLRVRAPPPGATPRGGGAGGRATMVTAAAGVVLTALVVAYARRG